MATRRLLLVLGSALTLSACAQLAPQRQGPAAEPAATGPATSTAAEAAKVATATEVLQAAPIARSKVAAVITPPEPVALDPVIVPQDLWWRIRQGFSMPVAEHPRVQTELAFFAQRPGYMERVTDRAEPYLHFIVEEIERRGLPMELALLPIVESAFQPFAYSPGRAAGIWQFIPNTGAHFGLKQTWWYDGRRDVIASTKAALTYLERLHAQFDDWELALAAYNAGQGTVRNAITRNTRAGRATDYWNLPLPNETRGYVPRLMALRLLIEQPEAHGLSLRSLANEPYLTVVETGSQMDLALAAELAGLSIQEIYQLNPGFNRWATDPEGPHQLVLPIERSERFLAGLSEMPVESRVRWHRHQVRHGQTLSHIARDFNTTVAFIQQANGLRNHNIRAGTHLIVPVSRQDAEHYALSAPQRLNQLQARERSGQRHQHTVRSGDTLWDISRSYGVTVNQLTAWNGMAPNDVLRPGQNLVVWLSGDQGQVRAASAAPAAAPQTVHYSVRRGDSLYAIAKRFNVSVSELRRWNNLPRQGYLQPGQRLRIIVDVTRQHGGAI